MGSRHEAVKIHGAKTNFSKLIGRVEAGEEVVVQRGDVPVAKVVPFEASARARKAGALKGRVEIAADVEAIPTRFRGAHRLTAWLVDTPLVAGARARASARGLCGVSAVRANHARALP